MDPLSLNLGELSIGLELENDRLRAGMGQAKRELQSLPPVARQEMVKVSRVFDEEGRKAGGKLSQGINQGLIRNSPLIVAGIGAALAAGAPLMIASATTLFAGIGGVAAAQSVEVRQAWAQLGHDIRDGAIEDAAVLVPVYAEMADKIGASFQRMRPQLRDAFEASAPLIRNFTDSVTRAAENALPGLVRAVERSGPVMDGFGSFLEDMGTGLTGFFDAMSSHAPAAGEAFESLGAIVGDLLPILGELLGNGAELASIVLPPLADVLGVVADVAADLGPLLPAIVLGFTGMKVANSVLGGVGAVAGKLTDVATQGGMASGILGRVGGGLGKVASAAGPAAAGIGLAVTAAMTWVEAGEKSAEVLQVLGSAFDVGGRQAKAASEYIDEFAMFNAALETPVGKAVGSIKFLGYSFDDLVPSTEDAKDAYDEWKDSLSGTDLATENVRVATEKLEQAVVRYGEKSPQAAAAAKELTEAQEEQARVAGTLELAISGVTTALVEQATQAIAAADAEFAYRDALNTLADQSTASIEIIKEFGAASDEGRDAMMGMEEEIRKTAAAAGRMASEELPAVATEMERDAVSSEAYLAELVRLRDEYGVNFPPALNQTIARLQATAGQMDTSGIIAQGLATDMENLGLSVNQIPGQKFVRVDAPTKAQIQQMKDLGYHVTHLPNGDVYVSASTGDAEAAINYAARPRTAVITAMQRVGNVLNGFGLANGGPIGRADGGPISGPGTTTSDSIPATGPGGARYALSNDEHIWTAREVAAAGGHGAVMGIRQAALAGAFRYAEGGEVPRQAALSSQAVSTSADRPWFHADTVNVIEGTPQDVGQQLMYKARTQGRG